MAGSNVFGPMDGGVMPYSSTFGGYSDPFSYLGDSRPMEHTFAFLQEGGGIGPRPNENGGIPTPDEVGVDKSDKSDEMERRLQQLRQARDMDVPAGMPRM
jgi:hypothetical protein